MFKFDLSDNAELRILQVSDAEEFLAFVEANRLYLGEWLNWVGEVHSIQDAQKFLQEGMEDFAHLGLPPVGIWQDGKMAGGLVFFSTNPRLYSTEVGYWLGAQYAGRGLMTRTLRAMLNYVFETIGYNRVALNAEVTNTRSRAVAERLGFTYEGIRRDGWRNGNRFVDLAMYAMLARDWEKIKPQ